MTLNWAYRIDSAFPAYGSPHGGTQVTGTTSVNDFLSSSRTSKRVQCEHVGPTSPFLTQAATSTTRPSPTTHGSTTNTSRPAAVAVEAVANPPPAEPSRSPPGRKRRPARRLARVHLLRIGRRRIPDAQLGLPDRFRLPGLRITPRRNPSHRNHLGQRLPERTSKRVQARLTLPFLTQAATSTTRPSPTTHGSTTNTSRPAAAAVEAVASPPPAEPSRSPLRSETPTSTPTCTPPSPTHRAAEDT